MHTVQASCTDFSGKKEHGGNAILTIKVKLMQVAHCSSVLVSCLLPLEDGVRETAWVSYLLLVRITFLPCSCYSANFQATRFLKRKTRISVMHSGIQADAFLP